MHKFISSRFGVNLGLILGRFLPSWIGYRVAALAAGIFSKSRSSLAQAVRQNQGVVRGGDLSQAQLEQAAEEVFTHAGKCFIDLYKSLKDPERMKAKFTFDAAAKKLIEYSQDAAFGAFVVAPHLSNFDLCLLAMAYSGLSAQVLTYGEPRGGYQTQNKIRAQTGLQITPVDENTESRAVAHLRDGGLVITGVDRPLRKKTQMLTFFDRPSPLPAGHIRMALQANVSIIVASAAMDCSGTYFIQLSDPIPMEKYKDRQADIEKNGENVLRLIADRIRKNPGQWLMYYPVWPDEKGR
jgi:KDO2-lipid IV(A) lauroyltransferase